MCVQSRVCVHVCVGLSQLLGGRRQVLWELSKPEVGAVDHVGLAATLGWTHWFAVALVAQPPVVRSYTHTHIRASSKRS